MSTGCRLTSCILPPRTSSLIQWLNQSILDPPPPPPKKKKKTKAKTKTTNKPKTTTTNNKPKQKTNKQTKKQSTKQSSHWSIHRSPSHLSNQTIIHKSITNPSSLERTHPSTRLIHSVINPSITQPIPRQQRYPRDGKRHFRPTEEHGHGPLEVLPADEAGPGHGGVLPRPRPAAVELADDERAPGLGRVQEMHCPGRTWGMSDQDRDGGDDGAAVEMGDEEWAVVRVGLNFQMLPFSFYFPHLFKSIPHLVKSVEKNNRKSR